ncbi:MAG: DHH family phosphoesterase [bacterium]|nr:DHH family phosphoesterase [bacterium]
MEYKKFIEELKSYDAPFQNTLNFIRNLKDKKVYLFSHDDPDGITSAVLMSRLLENLEVEHQVFFPGAFVLSSKDFPDSEYDAAIVMDKGTLPQYSEFGDLGKEFLFIDHHYTTGFPNNVSYYNPNADSSKGCSTSFLVHNILTALEYESIFYDFFCLVGLKGDFAIEPVTKVVSPYVKTFYDEAEKKFMKLLYPMHIKPTMFDVEQREKTCYLNQFAELIHAVSGGGFQFFYNDYDKSLKNVSQPLLSFDYLREIEDMKFHFADVTSLYDFVNKSSFKEPVSLTYQLFLKDWDAGISIIHNALLLEEIEDTGLFLYLGKKVRLMPMLGSVAVFDLKTEANLKNGLIVMASKEGEFTHFSVRATGGVLHSGKICGTMAENWKKLRQPNKHESLISGGGHPRAAECTAKENAVSFGNAIRSFLEIAAEIQNGSKQYHT